MKPKKNVESKAKSQSKPQTVLVTSSLKGVIRYRNTILSLKSNLSYSLTTWSTIYEPLIPISLPPEWYSIKIDLDFIAKRNAFLPTVSS